MGSICGRGRVLESGTVAGLMILAFSCHVFAAAPEPKGLPAITAFDRLPYLRLDTQAGRSSSFDRTGGKNDKLNYLNCPNFVAQPPASLGEEDVLCDIEGPGVIYRLWYTGLDGNIPPNLKIYLDNNPVPAFNTDSLGTSLFMMWYVPVAPFLRPLTRFYVEDGDYARGADVSFYPIPFAQHIKITTNNYLKNGVVTPRLKFFNIDYHVFTSDTNVASWTGSEDRVAADAAWADAKMTLDPKSTIGNAAAQGNVTIAAGTAATLLDTDGPRSIQAIRLNMNNSVPTESQLNSLWLRVYWDNETPPSVNAPLGSFFAIGQYGVGIAPRSLMLGLDASNTLYCYFPMPFETHAKVELYNAGASAIGPIAYEIAHRSFTDPFANVAYFKTQYNISTPSTPGRDMPVLNVGGSGHLVGVVQSVTGTVNNPDPNSDQNRIHLEGDERIYLDGSRTPVLQGTGTEDFYCDGFYFTKGTKTLPLWGHTQRIPGPPDRSSMYRVLIQDAIPFQRGIRMGIEHGHVNDSQCDAYILAMYYQAPKRLFITDRVDVGNATSESAHAYTVAGQTTVGSFTNKFEGDDDGVLVTDDGRAFTGYSQFTVKLAAENQGMVLRRMFDQGTAGQRANVYVDGAFVGAFYVGAGNPVLRWREEDFMIPATFTTGKTQATVKMEVASGAPTWNEYAYTVFSVGATDFEAPTITTNSGQNFSTGSESIVLEGTCSGTTTTITVNGEVISHQVGQTTWQATLPLSFGSNAFSVIAVSDLGDESVADTITITRPDDADNDGLSDSAETNTGVYVSPTDTGTSPSNPDTDDDGLSDGVETNTGIYLNSSNTGTNPLDVDTDGGWVNDGAEIARGTNPCVKADDRPTDLDGDGKTDALDIQLVINGALRLSGPYGTDIDRDDKTDIFDIQLAINVALGIPLVTR